ncbi:MAG: hypothetical protein IJ060_11465 [Oscillospiraceae bacterium]|nr:hypothetical protein [Oscillospiraceae bacterium]
MKKQNTDTLLTGAALLCRSGEWLPLWVLLLTMFSGTAQTAACCSVLFGLAALGTLTARLSFRMRNPSAAGRLRIITAILTAACGTAILWLITGKLVIPAILALITQGTVMSGADANPEKLYPFGAYLGFATGTVLAGPMLRAVSLPVPETLLFSAMCTVSALYFLLRNQFMLHRMVNRRSHADLPVPEEIRRGNLMLVGGVLLLIAAVFLFRGQLLMLLDAVRDLIVLVIGAVLRGIVRLIAWLGGSPPEEGEGNAPELTNDPLPEEGRNGSLLLLLWVVIAAVVLYLLRVVLADWIAYLREVFAAFIQKLRRGGAVRESGSGADYTDTETTALPGGGRRAEKRKWKKEYAAWRRLPDDSRKFYEGYRLMLSAPAWDRGALRDSDTVTEIQKKWAQDYEPETLLHAVTADFESDRYAEEGLPPKALQDMEQVLASLRRAK